MTGPEAGRSRRRRRAPQGRIATGNRVPADYLPDADIPEGDVIDRVLLYDFVTEEAGVLPRHRAALDRVRRYLGWSVPIQVWIGGVASRAQYAHNRPLSLLRAQNVARYLLRGGNAGRRGGRRVIVRHFGSDPATTGSENNPIYRAVLVVITRMRPPTPPTRSEAEEPPELDFFDRFKIALEHEVSGSALVGGGRLQFLIDYDTDEEASPRSHLARYVLWAGGIGVEAPIPDEFATAGSVAGAVLGMSSPLEWNHFTAHRNVTPGDFGGTAIWNNLGIEFGTGIALTSLNLQPASYDRGHRIVPFATPPGVTLGLQFLVGDFNFEKYVFGGYRPPHP